MGPQTIDARGWLTAGRAVPHALPYQGSKRALAPTILALIPDGTAHLREPCAGSAAVSLAALATDAVSRVTIADVDAPLMALWRRIRDDPAAAADGYEARWVGQADAARERFRDVRERFNTHHDPDDLLYLLVRCVKAAVRYNARGQFNQTADHRRLGTTPARMRARLMAVSALLAGRTTVLTGDFRDQLDTASPGRARLDDVVYLDPPYQGTSGPGDARYRTGLAVEELVVALRRAVEADLSVLVSYDGTSAGRRYGLDLPTDLGLLHLHLVAGPSSQGTLTGRRGTTVESLYVTPALVDRLGGASAVLARLRAGQ